jgi:hypothetical protein
VRSCLLRLRRGDDRWSAGWASRGHPAALMAAAPDRSVPQPSIHVIVTCTDRKTLPVPEHRHLATVPADAAGRRARAWIGRLTVDAAAPGVAARDLYAGEHWQVARGMTGLGAAGETVRLWACSAGYGLISATALIHPYAATFTPGHPDSVPPGDGAALWWQALARWEGPEPESPRSIRELVSDDPGATFFLALPPAYLQACQADIAGARSLAHDPEQIIIVSAGTRRAGDLAPAVVPTDARLQACLGGTRQALNARIAAHLLSAGIRRRADAADYLSALVMRQPPLPRYERQRLSDQEVLDLITARLDRPPSMSASRMLRELRDAGYACEQRRFGSLYQRAAGAIQ